jgi:hypothetical protein
MAHCVCVVSDSVSGTVLRECREGLVLDAAECVEKLLSPERWCGATDDGSEIDSGVEWLQLPP